MVAGDLKVVERGPGRQDVRLHHRGGRRRRRASLSPSILRPGDRILVSGTIGDHGTSGPVVPDGSYGVVVSAVDSCGNTAQKLVAVEVDNTAPTLSITSPTGVTPATVIEVHGSAADPHFQNYTLDVEDADHPGTWAFISTKSIPVSNDVLGTWNTYGITGTRTLRLNAQDTVGNKATVTATVTLGERLNLITNLSLLPRIFSPAKSNATVQYGLAAACSVTIEFIDQSGAVKYAYSRSIPSLGNYIYDWNGKDSSGMVVPDDIYTVKLTAESASNPGDTQTETVTAVVDTVIPAIEIGQPHDNAYLSTTVTVTGSINDTNLAQYTVTHAGSSGSVVLDSGIQNQLNHLFGTINDLAEGDYSLIMNAEDEAQNTAQKTVAFVIDRTAPVVTLNAPKDGEYYGANQNTVSESGSIVEKNLDTYTLRYASVETPAQWIELATGTTLTVSPQQFSWKVGSNDMLDGVYTLSLLAKDKAGLTGEAKVKITIDNTPPVSAITVPQEGGYVTKTGDIKGTAFDPNIDKYTIDISEGLCASAYKWASLRTAATTTVQDNVLTAWQALPSDGQYCIRLTVLDKVGLTSEAKVNIYVDTQPPAAPVLSGSIDNRSNAKLEWTGNQEPDLAGYNIYRDGQKVNTDLVAGAAFLDQNLTEATYSYTVKAVDHAGWESPSSNEVKIKIDLTGPDARIRSPKDSGTVSGLIDIKGTAYSSDDFKQYRISIGQGAAPANWTVMRTSPVPMTNDVFIQWNTVGLAEGELYSIKLEAEDLSGNISTHQVSVTIDNTPPAAPDLVSAATNSNNATITWNANTETDLAGYLLYRNEQLANVSGLVVGDLSSYLVTGASYTDNSLPDGTYTYYLVAVDQAGNESGQSRTLDVTIDIHPPHAAITDPSGQVTFEKTLMVKAESPDLDVASVQFQIRSAQSTTWTSVGSSITTMPYITYLDPSALNLAYGEYRLQAVATDKNQKVDPSPTAITVFYTDLTPPAAPTGLNALVSGGTASLAWTANTESDLDGYNIYRMSDGVRTLLTGTMIRTTVYMDSGLQNGLHTYEVSAVDTFGNESKVSNSATALVYSPILVQPYTPLSQVTISMSGNGATAGAQVELFSETGLQGSATVDSSGTFTVVVGLALGENKLTARITDSAGNVSKNADQVVVVYNETPAAPVGLAATVEGHNAHLVWEPSAEADVLGYNVFRDNVKLNLSDAAIPAANSASSSSGWCSPENATDSSLDTGWEPNYDVSAGNPVWWEMDLASPELISHVELHWGDVDDELGGRTLYAGKDFEVQVWSGYAWITQVKVTGNAAKNNVFDFKPAYRTDKIRIFITDSTDESVLKQVILAEVSVLKDEIISPARAATAYDDLNLPDRNYAYTVTAVDQYGFESSPSGTATAVMSAASVTAPVLSASVFNSDVILSWSNDSGQETALYAVYKNTVQGWVKLGTTSVSTAIYVDSNLPNGNYSYRITAEDAAGNESAPSNVVDGLVSISLPVKPENLIVSASSANQLNASWTYAGNTAAGFNVYRSTAPGGPYTKINESLASEMFYADSGIMSGITYYFVVAAVDSAGNISAYSDEAAGSTITPKPLIYFPTVSEITVTVRNGKTDIRGTAEPGSSMNLVQNGDSIGTTTALSADSVRSFSLNFDGNSAAISPDGKQLAYTYDGYIWLKSITTGIDTKAAQVTECYYLAWSPEGTKLAYTSYDTNVGNTHIFIYDTAVSRSVPLTDGGAFSDQRNPSWSPDGSKIMFVEQGSDSPGVWTIELGSGATTQLMTDIVWDIKMSPDGAHLAYIVDGTLYISDPANTTRQAIDSSADYTLEWSPNGKTLAFVSYRYDFGDVFIVDATNFNQSIVPGSGYYPHYLSWTADGRNLLFDIYDYWVYRDTLWLGDANGTGATAQIMPDLGNVWYMESSKAGTISLVGQNNDGSFTAYLLDRSGGFAFEAVSLTGCENVFTAAAVDGAGNPRASSDPVTVTYEPSANPDLSVTVDDVYLYPPLPIAGQKMAVNAVISNLGQASAGSTALPYTHGTLWNSWSF